MSGGVASGWSVYYVVSLSAFMGLGIPLALKVISSVVSSHERFRAPSSKQFSHSTGAEGSEGTEGKRINPGFFLAVNSALALTSLVLLAAPAVGILGHQYTRDERSLGIAVIVSIAVLASLGLLYGAKRGDLSWHGLKKNKGAPS